MARVLQKQIIAQLGVKQVKHTVVIPDRVREVREQICACAKEMETAMSRDKKDYSWDVLIFKKTADLLEKSCASDAWFHLNKEYVRNNKARDYKFRILPRISALMPNGAGGNYKLEKVYEIAYEEKGKSTLILCKSMNSAMTTSRDLCGKTASILNVVAGLKSVTGKYDVIINIDANLKNRGILLKHIKDAGTMHEIVAVEPKKSKFAQKNPMPSQIQY